MRGRCGGMTYWKHPYMVAVIIIAATALAITGLAIATNNSANAHQTTASKFSQINKLVSSYDFGKNDLIKISSNDHKLIKNGPNTIIIKVKSKDKVTLTLTLNSKKFKLVDVGINQISRNCVIKPSSLETTRKDLPQELSGCLQVFQKPQHSASFDGISLALAKNTVNININDPSSTIYNIHLEVYYSDEVVTAAEDIVIVLQVVK
jgi:hypothetical protein